MGIGMVLIVDKNSVRKIQSKLVRLGLKNWLIGEITKGKKQVEIL